MNRDHFRLSLMLLLLTLAVVLKVDRYAHGKDASITAAVDSVVALMAKQGWKAEGGPQLANGVFEELRFRHDGCASPIVVALIHGNTETAEFFRTAYGDDSMFFDGGNVVSNPGGLGRLRRKVNKMTHQVAATLGLNTSPVLPLLGIAPASGADVSDCRGPSQQVWRQLGTATFY